jgi:hypothetical protein
MIDTWAMIADARTDLADYLETLGEDRRFESAHGEIGLNTELFAQANAQIGVRA